MMTNIGIIKNLMNAWGEANNTIYGTRELHGWDENGEIVNVEFNKENDSFAAIAYRKFVQVAMLVMISGGDIMLIILQDALPDHWVHSESGVYEGRIVQLKKQEAILKVIK